MGFVGEEFDVYHGLLFAAKAAVYVPGMSVLTTNWTSDAMKSVKKRFKIALSEVEDAANDLLLIAADVVLLESVQELATSALRACKDLELRAKRLHKAGFAEQIVKDEALLLLDDIVDNDVMSVVEQRFSAALEGREGQALDMMRQLLEKLEKKLAFLNDGIQRLGGLLNETE